MKDGSSDTGKQDKLPFRYWTLGDSKLSIITVAAAVLANIITVKPDKGTALVTAALAQGNTGLYQLQAAIAAVHDEAETIDDTAWPADLGLNDVLELTGPNSFTTLNRFVAAPGGH
jgi:hypothetical protein